MSDLNLVTAKIRSVYMQAIQEITWFRDDLTITVPAQALIPVAKLLRDDPDLRFEHLADMSSQDRSKYPGLDGAPRFVVVYQLLSPSTGQRVRLKVAAEGGDAPSVPTHAAASRPAASSSAP